MKKKLHPLSERLGASLGIMGDKLRASLKPLDTIVLCDVPRGFMRGGGLVPHDCQEYYFSRTAFVVVFIFDNSQTLKSGVRETDFRLLSN